MPKDTYAVVVNRDHYYEVKNAYVRWDDYGGGDSEWRGGDIQVCSNPYGREIPESVKDAVLKWCKHWLPTETELRASPGWRIKFEVEEWLETGYEAKWSHVYIKPILTEAVRDLMLRKATEQVYVALK